MYILIDFFLIQNITYKIKIFWSKRIINSNIFKYAAKTLAKHTAQAYLRVIYPIWMPDKLQEVHRGYRSGILAGNAIF
jgi:hypothetical protein